MSIAYDGIRNILGGFQSFVRKVNLDLAFLPFFVGASGGDYALLEGNDWTATAMVFDAASVVPTANDNRVLTASSIKWRRTN